MVARLPREKEIIESAEGISSRYPIRLICVNGDKLSPWKATR